MTKRGENIFTHLTGDARNKMLSPSGPSSHALKWIPALWLLFILGTHNQYSQKTQCVLRVRLTSYSSQAVKFCCYVYF